MISDFPAKSHQISSEHQSNHASKIPNPGKSLQCWPCEALSSLPFK